MLTNIRSYTEHPDVLLLFTDVCKILESVLILPTCGNIEILFLPPKWRYFLITIPSCIYGNVHQRAQSWPVGPLGFKNSCMLILIFFTRLYVATSLVNKDDYMIYYAHTSVQSILLMIDLVLVLVLFIFMLVLLCCGLPKFPTSSSPL